ncbi:hypothetical protein ACGFSI_11570 [Streptomyces virginiae]|uniref:hypothetical protein n=1 Tax=Streptomyces virginiae TaxID=1961 RepID=UPI00371F45D8
MGLKAELLTKPGLLDLSEQEPEPDVMYGAVESFLATPGVSGTEVESNLRDALSRATQGTEEGFNWIASVRQWLKQEKHSVFEEEEQMVELGAYWLTVPAVSGASAQLNVNVEHSGTSAASFKLAGVGGGPEFTIKVNEGVTMKATSGERIVLSAPGKIQTIAVTRRGRKIASYPKLAALDKNNLTWTARPAEPPSPPAGARPSETKRYDASDSRNPIGAIIQVARGTSWEFGVDFKVEKLGMEVKSTTRVSYQSDVMFTYELPAGGCYVAAQYADIPARRWSLEAIKNKTG